MVIIPKVRFRNPSGFSHFNNNYNPSLGVTLPFKLSCPSLLPKIWHPQQFFAFYYSRVPRVFACSVSPTYTWFPCINHGRETLLIYYSFTRLLTLSFVTLTLQLFESIRHKHYNINSILCLTLFYFKRQPH